MSTISYPTERAVYKFLYNGIIYYKLGNGLQDARLQVAKKLNVISQDIQILDKGSKQ